MSLSKNNPYLFAVMVLCWFTAIAETDIYVPSFPDMVTYFGIPEPQIQDVLSYNFFAIFFSCLFYGPLSDRYGRKPVLLWGMVLFSLASLGCLIASTFPVLVGCRFVQGLGASCIFTVGVATFSDHYPPDKAATKIGYINTLIGFGMAAAPSLGSYLTLEFGWRGNFWCVFILGVLSALGLAFFYQETLPEEKRQKINMQQTLKNYQFLLSSRSFMLNMSAVFLLVGGMISYVSNLSLIFINYLHVPETIYPFYQGTPLFVFAVVSFLSGRVIQKFGVRPTCTAGFVGTFFFFSLLALLCMVSPKSPLLMTLIASAGISMMSLSMGSIYVIAMEPFMHLKEAVSSLMTALRMLSMGLIVEGVSYTFNGTTVALSLSLWVLAAFGTAAYFGAKKQ